MGNASEMGHERMDRQEFAGARPELEQLLKNIIRMFMGGHLQFRPRVSQIPFEIERSVSRLRQARGTKLACKGTRPSRPHALRGRRQELASAR